MKKWREPLEIAVSSIFLDTAVNLCFADEQTSKAAYNKMREMQIKCYHVGKNAPYGPYLSIYMSENMNLKMKTL